MRIEYPVTPEEVVSNNEDRAQRIRRAERLAHIRRRKENG